MPCTLLLVEFLYEQRRSLSYAPFGCSLVQFCVCVNCRCICVCVFVCICVCLFVCVCVYMCVRTSTST